MYALANASDQNNILKIEVTTFEDRPLLSTHNNLTRQPFTNIDAIHRTTHIASTNNNNAKC